MQQREGSGKVCGHCGCELRRGGVFCPVCGCRLASHNSQPEPDLPRYHKRSRRVLAPARCGSFHHELMVNVFSFRFCPECGRRLGIGHPEPEVN